MTWVTVKYCEQTGCKEDDERHAKVVGRSGVMLKRSFIEDGQHTIDIDGDIYYFSSEELGL